MVQFQRRIRAVKHVALRHSDLQVKVFDATSNDPNTPSAEQLEELTHLAYQCEIADELVTLLLKRMQTTDPKRYWYRVYKSLLIVEYLLLYGPDKVVRGFWSRFQELQEFERFRYNDDSGFDHTVHIRELARRITKVLIDPAILSDNRKRTSKVTFETAQSSTAFTSLSLSMSSSDSLRHSPSDSYSRFKRDSAILGSSLELPRTPESPHGEADLDVMVIGHEHSTEESEWLATMDILGIPRTAEETPSESKEEWLSELSPSSPISISSLWSQDSPTVETNVASTEGTQIDSAARWDWPIPPTRATERTISDPSSEPSVATAVPPQGIKPIPPRLTPSLEIPTAPPPPELADPVLGSPIAPPPSVAPLRIPKRPRPLPQPPVSQPQPHPQPPSLSRSQTHPLHQPQTHPMHQHTRDLSVQTVRSVPWSPPSFEAPMSPRRKVRPLPPIPRPGTSSSSTLYPYSHPAAPSRPSTAST